MSYTFALIGIPDGKRFVKAIRKDKKITFTENRDEAMKFESADQAMKWGQARLTQAFVVGVYRPVLSVLSESGGEK